VSAVQVWRLCAGQRAPLAFTGDGSARRGGRWNGPGIRIVYCAESRALAALEILAHSAEIGVLGSLEWVCLAALIPDDCIEKPRRFPSTWRQFPHSVETRVFGDTWVRESRSAALRVPSAVVPGEFNYLLNPAHPDFARLELGRPEPFLFDPRLAG
jgi:RES domain-containing protein